MARVLKRKFGHRAGEHRADACGRPTRVIGRCTAGGIANFEVVASNACGGSGQTVGCGKFPPALVDRENDAVWVE